MKKILSIAVMALMAAGSAFAQNYVTLGAGMPFTSYQFGNMEADVMNSTSVFAGYSHNFGFGTSSFGIEPGLNFVYEFSTTDGEILDAKIKNNYLGFTAPVLFNYCFAPASDIAFKVFAGPSLHYGLMDKSATYVADKFGYKINNYKENEDLGRFNASASIAIAAEWADTFRVKLGYDFGLTDINHSDTIKEKQQILSVAFSYIF